MPSPDRVAAGDAEFDPTQHLYVDGVWWSSDGRYRWTGDSWAAPPAEPDAVAEDDGARESTRPEDHGPLDQPQGGFRLGYTANPLRNVTPDS